MREILFIIYASSNSAQYVAANDQTAHIKASLLDGFKAVFASPPPMKAEKFKLALKEEAVPC